MAVFARFKNGDCRTSAACTARSADAMHVGFIGRRDAEIDDVRQVFQIDAASGNIGGDNRINLAGSGITHNAVTSWLIKAAVQRLDAVAADAKCFSKLIDFVAGAGEDDGKFGILKIENAAKTSGTVTGIPTGFIDLDYRTAGLQPSDLILIAARPSMGKTAFVLNIAQYVAFHEHMCTAIFSLEMSKEQLVNRLFSLESRVDAQALRTGNLSDSDWEKLIEGAGTIGNSELIIDDTPGISIAEMRSKCRKYKLEHDLKLIIIDYLQLMSGSGRGSDSRQQEISDISRSLKALARELSVPVIALSQLSRAVEQRPDHRPMLSDLRESGAIEQDADVVMFIYRDDYYNHDSEMKGISEIIIAKQRNGPIGTVNLVWLPQYTKFANMEK